MIEIHFKDEAYAKRAKELLENRREAAPYTYSVFQKRHALRISSVRMRRDTGKDLSGENWAEFRIWCIAQTNLLEKAARRAALRQSSPIC
jgi:hypothetical protein